MLSMRKMVQVILLFILLTLTAFAQGERWSEQKAKEKIYEVNFARGRKTAQIS